jgi:hypothetical protein
MAQRLAGPTKGSAMRPWIIVLSSTAVAIAAAAAIARPALSLTPPAAIIPALMPLVPTLVVTALAVYALCAIVLTASTLVVVSLGLRRQLTYGAAHLGSARADWTAALADSGLQRLAPLPAFLQPRSIRSDGVVVLRGQFHPGEARREMAQLYYIWAARTHFFSALIALAGAVALGVAQQHGPLPLVPGLIPTMPAGLILAGLILLAILARLAIDVTIDPLIEAISGCPAESLEVALIRRAVDLLETAPTPRADRDLADPAPISSIPDRLIGALEEGHRALTDAIERLSTTTDGLASTTRSSIEAVESSLRAAEQRQSSMAVSGTADAAELSQLRQAVVALTSALERIPTGSVASKDTAPGAEPASRHRAAQPDLADQLKQLLQDIGTTP